MPLPVGVTDRVQRVRVVVGGSLTKMPVIGWPGSSNAGAGCSPVTSWLSSVETMHQIGARISDAAPSTFAAAASAGTSEGGSTIAVLVESLGSTSK